MLDSASVNYEIVSDIVEMGEAVNKPPSRPYPPECTNAGKPFS